MTSAERDLLEGGAILVIVLALYFRVVWIIATSMKRRP